jgi:hypothetical protein
MPKDRKCRACGGTDEFMYEISWRPVFYCANCDKETGDESSESVGPVERFKEETGE